MIRLERVVKYYGRTRALSPLSLELSAGQLGVLRGPNGSGKSTALKVAAGLALPDQGVRKCGTSQVGFAGHHSQLNASASIRQSLRLQTELFNVPFARLAEWANRFGVSGFWHKRQRALSQGMSQRAKLARAFACGDRLLILDEPQTGLDQAAIDLLFRELAAALSNGTAVLLATHLDLPDMGADMLEFNLQATTQP